MERLAILIALFVILVVVILARRRASLERADAPTRMAPTVAVAADPAGATLTPRPLVVEGPRSPYARLGTCPTCGRPMVERVGKHGALKGKPYLVCSGDPPCAPVENG